jgi:hypothetical protein
MDHHEPEPADTSRAAAPAAAAALRDAVVRLVAAVTPALQALAQAYKELGRQLHDAGVIEEHGRPARRSDRAAWQSPYGPRTRRR